MVNHLKMVKENGFNIKDVPADEQTEGICIAAVTDKPMAIQYITNPSENVCKAALLKDPDVLDFIGAELIKAYRLKDFAIEASLEQLKLQQQAEKDAADIKYLKGGGSLENIESPSYEVCKIAVQQNGNTLKYVPEGLKTAEMCKIAIEECGRALQYVPEALRSTELCKIAVENWGLALQYVPEVLKTSELCKIAVERCGWALEFVPEALKTVELCKIAVRRDGRALKFVPEKIRRSVLLRINETPIY